MRTFIVENGVLTNFDSEKKSLFVKSVEELKNGNGFYRGVRAIVITTSNPACFVEEYNYAKEKFMKYMKSNCKYDSWKTFSRPVEVIDDKADETVEIITNYKSSVAKVSKEVKAAEVKHATVKTETKTEEIKEETTMSEVMFTAAQVAALLAATATTAPATKIEYKEIVKEVVPSDYDQLKKDLETAKKTASTWQSKCSELKKQIAELKAQLAASSKVDTNVPTLKEDLADEKFEQEVKDVFDSTSNEDFCDFNKAINLVAEAEARKEKKKADAAEEAKRKGIVTKYFDAYSAFHFVKGNLDYIKNACPDKRKWQSFADEIEDYDCFTAEEITFVRDVAYGC